MKKISIFFIDFYHLYCYFQLFDNYLTNYTMLYVVRSIKISKVYIRWEL